MMINRQFHVLLCQHSRTEARLAFPAVSALLTRILPHGPTQTGTRKLADTSSCRSGWPAEAAVVE